MKYALTLLFGLMLIPSVSYASTLTTQQTSAIIQVLQAFGVDAATIANVQAILQPVSQQTVTPPVTTPTTTPSTNAPAIIQTPMTQQTETLGSVAPSKWTINVETLVDGKPADPVVKAGTGKLGLSVTVLNPSNKVTKVPVTVTTDDPDFADSTFVINQPGVDGLPGQPNFFCVAPHSSPFVNNGCPIENPVATGKFTFTFTAEDATKTVEVTVE